MSTKKNFIPDYRQTESLVKAGKTAATNAVRQSKALDLPVAFIRDGVIYEEDADGTTRAIKKTDAKRETPFVLTKGMVLHAK